METALLGVDCTTRCTMGKGLLAGGGGLALGGGDAVRGGGLLTNGRMREGLWGMGGVGVGGGCMGDADEGFGGGRLGIEDPVDGGRDAVCGGGDATGVLTVG